MIKLFASALRIGGVVAAVGGMLLVSGETLAAAIAAAGLEHRLAPPVARIAGLAIFALIGFIVGSRLAEVGERKFAAPAGRRQDAVESVPRLRRHLVEGDGGPAGKAAMHYLDPDPAPTAPVAVSFAELGLEPPRACDYPPPAGGEAPDDFLFAASPGRPESAGSASDEWDDCPVLLPRATPPQPPVAAREAEPPPPPAAADRGTTPAAGASTQDDFEAVAEEIERLQSRLGPADSAPAAQPPETAAPAQASRPSAPAEAPPVAAAGPVGNDGYSRPSFSRPDATPDSGWYDGAADDEDEAEDDGAGYGSLIAIGLGKNHAPRGAGGQRGEAGLPARADGGTRALAPHGKPQDFRLREALAELDRLA